jgi:hypothetical protein
MMKPKSGSRVSTATKIKTAKRSLVAPFFLCYYAIMDDKTLAHVQRIMNGMASRLLLKEWRPSRTDYEKVLNQLKEAMKD